MANVQEHRPRLPYGAREKRSVGLLVLLLLAVFAAIFFVHNMSARRHQPAASAPVASTELPTAPPPEEQVPAAAVAPAAAAAAAEEPALSARKQSDITRVVEDGRPALTACYQRALVRDETLVNGNLKVRMSVAPSGRVDTVNISGPRFFSRPGRLPEGGGLQVDVPHRPRALPGRVSSRAPRRGVRV